MSNKLNKESTNKHWVDKWIVILGIFILTLLGAIAVMKYNTATEDKLPTIVTKEWLQSKVKEAIDVYPYADVQWNSCILDSNNEVQYMSEYNLFTTGKEEGSWKTYSLYDYNNGVSSRISWKSPVNGEPAEVYAYDSLLGVYVTDTTTEDIVDMNPWSIVDDLSRYTLSEEEASLEGIPCYLLYYLTQDEDGAITSDEIYIDKETFLPILIMVSSEVSSTMKQETIDNIDKLADEYEDALADIGITSVEDVEGTINSYSSFIMMYSFGYYNQDAAAFTVPDDYVTVDEWNVMYDEYLSSLSEEDADEPSEEGISD